MFIFQNLNQYCYLAPKRALPIHRNEYFCEKKNPYTNELVAQLALHIRKFNSILVHLSSLTQVLAPPLQCIKQ